MKRALLLSVSMTTALLLLAGWATAEIVPDTEADEEDHDSAGIDVACVAGLRWGTPQRLSAPFGAVIGRDLSGHSFDRHRGLLAQIEPGLDGGRVSLGYAAISGFQVGPRRFPVNLPLSGYAIKASLLRTWADPLGCRPDQTYAGAEAVGAYCFASASVGILRHVQGDDDRNDWILSASIGIGF